MKLRLICIIAAIAAYTAMASAQAPLVGISSGLNKSGAATLGGAYTEAVANAGGIPVVIPLVKDSLLAEALVSRLDAVIFSGGEDVDPHFYGEEPIPELGEVNADRDTSDLLLIRTAVRLKKPILGICRGEQAINVALGGTLWQDLPSQYLNALTHRQDKPASQPTHDAIIYRESVLYDIVKVDKLGVNTFHHQAVKDIAPGLTVTARAADGVIEAYEGFPQYNVIGVQFHPEAFARLGEYPYLSIFENLVSRAKAR